MRITIDSKILSKYNINVGEFLVLLIAFFNEDFTKSYESLIEKKILLQSIFKSDLIVLTARNKELISKILAESNEQVINSKINFDELAGKLQELYPEGIKPNTGYTWRGETEEIAQKLRTLVALHHFQFTEKEAIEAVKKYVDFMKDKKYMSVLKYFILKSYEDEDGEDDIESSFMSIIEFNRSKKQ